MKPHFLKIRSWLLRQRIFLSKKTALYLVAARARKSGQNMAWAKNLLCAQHLWPPISSGLSSEFNCVDGQGGGGGDWRPSYRFRPP
jgi:hypothetical protein